MIGALVAFVWMTVWIIGTRALLSPAGIRRFGRLRAAAVAGLLLAGPPTLAAWFSVDPAERLVLVAIAVGVAAIATGSILLLLRSVRRPA